MVDRVHVPVGDAFDLTGCNVDICPAREVNDAEGRNLISIRKVLTSPADSAITDSLNLTGSNLARLHHLWISESIGGDDIVIVLYGVGNRS